MDCIPYINDLQIEIQILKDVRASGNCDIASIDKKIMEKEILIETCKVNLSKLSNNQIEYRIYLKILNGTKPTKAVEEIANENYINNIKPASTQSIWAYNYPKLKKIINVE